MDPQDGKGASRVRQQLGLLAVGALVLAVVAMACHPWGKHVDGVHSTIDVENVCVQLEDSQLSFDKARSTIASTLFDSRGWRSRETVSFDLNPVECDNLSAADLVEQEIEFHIYSGALPCTGSEGFNGCANPDPDTELSHGTHLNYLKVRIQLQDLTLAPFYVNHETGHALGLADPTPTQAPNKNAETCVIPVDSNRDGVQDIDLPVASIMHNAPRCPGIPVTSLSWPLGQDLYSFDVNVAQEQ